MTNPFSETEKKFSILTPCYKDTYKHLDKFLDSLVKQEYKSWEWCLTFDGKSAKGQKVMDRIIKDNPDLEISYHVIEHAGACAARNNCAQYATGDFYAFLSPDCWMYPETLRMWANAFEDPKINRVWGMYDVIDDDGNTMFPVGQAPVRPDGSVWYPAFQWSPYADASFPVRKEAFVPWDEDCKSLNDWEYSIRLLKQSDFRGDDWKYIPYHFFAAETPQKGGLSNDSAENWIERRNYVQRKNGITANDICVTSLGAQHHAYKISEMLGADYLPMPSFKPHDYKAVYLLGFYSRENGQSRVTQTHMDIFTRNKGKNIVHWIGTDILDLYWFDSFMKLKVLRKWFKDNKVIHLCEADFTQKELKEIGIEAKIVPLPVQSKETLPLPEEFSVGVYLPGRDLYKEPLIMEVTRSMPDVQFYFFGDESRRGVKGDNWEHLGYVDLDEWLPKLSCNLRITDHDGLPITPLEFLMAGRNVVTNTPVKGAIRVEETVTKFNETSMGISDYREQIVAGIREAQSKPLDESVSRYWRKEISVEKYQRTIRGLL